MADWEFVNIGSIAQIFDGPHATPKKIGTGPWFLSISSLKGGRLDLSESAHISDEGYERWTRRVTPLEGDVLFSYETRLGEAALMPSGLKACLGRRMGLLRPNIRVVDPRFMLYAYLGPEFQRVIIERSIRGATVDRIPLAELANWPIRIPGLSVQRAIGRLLGTLDDKIVMNDRIAKSADSLAEAHFIRILAGETRTSALGQLVEFKYGKALKEQDRALGRVPVFGGNGVSGWHDTPLGAGPGIVVGRKGANAGSVSWSQGPFWAIDTSFYVEPLSARTPLEFIFFLLQNAGLRNHVGDSAIPGLNREIALSLNVQMPEEEAIVRFADLARSLLGLRAQMREESRVLAELRDALLPKLMSGEIRVRDAEKAVEDVT